MEINWCGEDNWGEEKGEEMEIWREVGGHYFDRAGADRRVCSIIRPE